MSGRDAKAAKLAAATALLLFFALALWDAFVAAPGYASGDEQVQVSLLQTALDHGPLAWGWAQGSLQRAVLFAFFRLGFARPGWMHLPGLCWVALESALLFKLARRWAGEEAAFWSLAAALLAASTWLRARSLLSFQDLPALSLGMALASAQVRGRASALAWGLLAGALAVDYEGVLIALPLVWAACLVQEEGFRRRWLWSLGGGALALAALALLQAGALADYVVLRKSFNVAQGAAGQAQVLAQNLRQVFLGGAPLPYLGIKDWPAIPLWTWPALGMALWAARRGTLAALAAWAALAVLATQATLSPYGVPVHRLAAAWAPLCLLSGAGMAALRRQSGRAWPLFLALLAVLAAGEAAAFVRQQRGAGAAATGDSAVLQAACERAAAFAARNGGGVSYGLVDWRFRLAEFHLKAAGCPLGLGENGQAMVVLIPPDLRAAAGRLHGSVQALQAAHGEGRLILATLQGPEAARFRAVEAVLRQARSLPTPDPSALRAEVLARLRRDPPADIWAWSSLVRTMAWPGFGSKDRDGQLPYSLYRYRPVNDPAIPVQLATLASDASLETAVGLCHEALAIDPDYVPALSRLSERLARLGRSEDAAAADRQAARLLAAGAWELQP